GWETIDGALFDLGVSSMQIDTAERGFSFQKAGPLDMRMDPSSGGPTAADLVNRLPEAELRDILFRYGEEPRARQVVREIVRARERAPIETTTGLADVVGPSPARASAPASFPFAVAAASPLSRS
ncbi:MAG: 16S rRNA (cytosine(1402)-N(4))-methyltransferase, partial [Nitrospirae bacterium]|nr:16S rRNA (cytosine(1402)-N(4))-methyltransferase [Nitrospirota bacterium]